MKSSNKKLVSAAILFVAFFSIAWSSLPVRADESLFNSQVGMSDVETVYGKKTPQDVRVLAVKFINIALGFLGLIFLFLTIYSGVQWMMSGGDEAKVGEAKKRLTNSVIGLAILLSAWVITRYILVVLNKTIINQAVDYTYY